MLWSKTKLNITPFSCQQSYNGKFQYEDIILVTSLGNPSAQARQSYPEWDTLYCCVDIFVINTALMRGTRRIQINHQFCKLPNSMYDSLSQWSTGHHFDMTYQNAFSWKKTFFYFDKKFIEVSS